MRAKVLVGIATALALISLSAPPTMADGESATPTPTDGQSATPTPTNGQSATPTPTDGESATPTIPDGESATPTDGESATPTPTPTSSPSKIRLTKIKLSSPGLKKKAKTTTTLLRLATRRGIAWTATPKDPWIHVVPPAGVGTTWIKITLDTNPLVVGDMAPTRESLITFAGADLPTYFPIVQKSTSTSLSVQSPLWYTTWEGQSKTFSYATYGTARGFDCSQAADSNSANRPWISVTDVTYDPTTTSGTVTVDIQPNDGAAREGMVKVTCGHKSKAIKIKQAAGPSVNVSPVNLRPRARGGVALVSVVSPNGPWTAEVVDGADWLSVAPASGGSAKIKVSVTVAPNHGPARTGTIRFSNGLRPTVLTVTQAAGG